MARSRRHADRPASWRGQKIISDAQLEIEVETGKFQTVFNQALLLADRYGGYVVSSNSQASGEEDSMKSGTVAIRVPAASFSKAMGDAGKLGEVKNQNIQHPGRHRGVRRPEARITNSEANVKALLGPARQGQDRGRDPAGAAGAHLRPAGTGAAKGRLRYLDEHTSYSTLTMSIYETGVRSRSAGEWGFVGAFKDALHNLVRAVNEIVRGLGC